MVKWVLYVYLIWFACGFVLITGGWLPSWLEWANSVYLILAGFVMLVWMNQTYGYRSASFFFLVCGGLSLLSEWFGVHTGLWFGTYSYGEGFAPFLFGVPIAIPLAWCLIIGISHYLSFGNRFIHTLVGASAATSIDLILDPVAVQQGYWTWQNLNNYQFYAVPLTNFVSWWVTAAIIIYLIYPHLRKPKKPMWKIGILPIPLLVLLTLELLFLTLSFQYSLWYAAAINIVCIIIVGWLRYVNKEAEAQ